MLKTPIDRLRFIGIIEGISFLLLLFIAMPLKYALDIPEPVTVVGMIHGVLFFLYLLAILNAIIDRKLTIGMTVFAIAAAFLPFGPFVLDRKLR